MNELNDAIKFIQNFEKELLSKFIYEVNEDNTYTIFGVSSEYGKDKDFSIIIPTNTKRIADRAFESVYVEKVILPEGLEEIGDYAFYFCINLKNIYFSSTVKKIGDYAFYHCNRLLHLLLPDALEYIGENAFTGCDLVEKVIIPETVTYIGSGAFERCINLHYIQTKLKEKPDGWQDDFYDEFDVTYCKTLQVIYGSTRTPLVNHKYKRVVAEKLEDYEYELYGENRYRIIGLVKKDATDLIIPKKVAVIGEQAFFNNKNIRRVFLSNTVNKIETEAFDLCTNMVEFRTSTSLKEVEFRVFNKCRYLKEITFYKNTKFVQPNAFWGCTKLKTIYVHSIKLYNNLKNNVQDCKAKVVLNK